MPGLYTETLSDRCPGGHQPTLTRDRVPAAGAVRRGWRRALLLDRAGAVRGPDLDRRGRPGVGRPVDHPLDPRRVRDRVGQAGIAPDAVDRDLDPRDAAVRRPGDPGDRDVTGRDAAARRVDPRLGEDRSLLGPAERDPVAVERLERRQLELLEPLRRRDVAVQAGDDEPGRDSRGSAAAARRSSSARSSARAPGP